MRVRPAGAPTLDRMAPPPQAPGARPALRMAPQDSVKLSTLTPDDPALEPETQRPDWRRWALAGAGAVAAAASLAGPVASPAWAAARPVPGHHLEVDSPRFPGHQSYHDHGGNWDRQLRTGPDGMRGWTIPRNTDPTPVKPGFAYEVPLGTRDLGPVRALDNTRGRIRALRLQWPAESDPRARDAHVAMFRDLLTGMDPDVRFEIVAEAGGERDVRALVDSLNLPNPDRVHVHPMPLRSTRQQYYQGMGMWARDGSVTLTRLEDGREVLLLPRTFRDDGQVDAYLNRVLLHGTGEAPAFLSTVEADVAARRSDLDFEGGDVLANGRHVLVSGATVDENARRLGETREQVQARFEREFGMKVLVADPEPDFHLDLGIGFLDDHTVTIASPSLAEDLLARAPASGSSVTEGELATMREATKEKDLAGKYRLVADRLQAAGYRVVEMPNLAGRSLSSPYLTYQNVLLERYTRPDGTEVRKVYMPTYGLSVLDRAAREAYEAEGFEVVPFRSPLLSTRLGGGIRCAVGELDIAN